MTAPVAECHGCGGEIRTTADAAEHAGCHLAGDLAEGPLCGQQRPLFRIAGVDLPLLPCVRPAGHGEGRHRAADGSEWADTVPDWWEDAQEQIGDILAALIRRGGSDVAEIADDDLRRADGEVVRIQYDDGCARVEITTEVPSETE